MIRSSIEKLEVSTEGARRVGSAHRSLEEDGFALLAAVLALVAITGLAAAGFLLASTEYRITQNHRSSVYAFYAADEGLSDVLGGQGVPQATSTFTYAGGREATVTSEALLELESGIRLYGIASNGRHETPLTGSARNLGSVALFTPFPLNVPGALTAPNGLLKNGADGTVTGYDVSPPGSCPGAGDAVAGVAVPPNGYTQNGNPSVPTGDPPIDDSQPAPQIVESTGIDWGGLVSEDKVVPDYVVPGDEWPDFTSLPADEWPVIHVTAATMEVQPIHSGRGVIVFDGDAELNGEFQWDGILLIGGQLISDGNQTVDGAVFTGMNRAFGVNVPASDLGNGEKSFRFHHCNVEEAKRAMGWLAPKPGTWFEKI